MMDVTKVEDRDMNRDPITGAPGAHPIGTGVGAASGAVAGAAMGSVAGPLGATVAGLVGAVVGGLAGKEVGEAVNPTAEDPYWENYWRESYRAEPYYQKGYTYEDYAAAYRVAYIRHSHDPDLTWGHVEAELQAEWELTKGASRLDWKDAWQAAHAAWIRIEDQLPPQKEQAS